MYGEKDKRRLYWLIDLWLSRKIDLDTFRNEYHYCYVHGLEVKDLNELERRVFLELLDVSERFSESEEDHRCYPGVYYTVEELKQKIVETKTKLQQYWI